MQTIQTSSPRPLSAFHNPNAATLGKGMPYNWARIPDDFALGKFSVKLDGAVAIGANALTVDALPYPLKQGVVLKFGTVENVLVTVGSGGALANSATVPVTALPNPLPAGAILDFTGAGKFVKLTAAALAGATSIAVETDHEALTAGDTATYQGGEQNVEVAEDTDAGATSIVTQEVPFAIADNTEALADITSLGQNGNRFVPAATVLARDKTNGLFIPRSVTDDAAEPAVGFAVSDANENSKSDAKSGYGIIIGNTTIYENLCPDSDDAGDLPAAYKTELAANSLGFVFEDWEDSRIA